MAMAKKKKVGCSRRLLESVGYWIMCCVTAREEAAVVISNMNLSSKGEVKKYVCTFY
jgi:hypothetical protein